MRDLSIIPAILNSMDGIVLLLVSLGTLLAIAKIVFEMWGDH